MKFLLDTNRELTYIVLMDVLLDASAIISMQNNTEKNKSPLENINGINTDISMKEILDAIKESRERK